jgi:nucleoside-diphosphate-sugar epimerase
MHSAEPSAFARASRHLFIFGLGYVGERIGLRAAAAGWHVSGSVRSREKMVAFENSPIDCHCFDIDEDYCGLDTLGLAALRDATHVVATVPPVADFDRDPLLALHRQQLLIADGRLCWAGYLSTTGVYGDHAGAWVDESSETRAAPGSRAKHRLDAEAEWLALSEQSTDALAVRVFRLAGIYGPGRSAVDTVTRIAARSITTDEDTSSVLARRQETLVAMPAVRPGESKPISRIHVDDICSAVLASMDIDQPSAEHPNKFNPADIYNVADDDPAPREQVMEHAATLLGLPREVAAEAASGNTRSRARRIKNEHKRVRNTRLRSHLLTEGLRFPTYREGLAQIMSQRE